MRMELIQPFINSADAVLAQGLQGPTSVENLSMEEEAYRRKGIAAEICLTGEIEGRIIFDLDPQTAVKVASCMAWAMLRISLAVIMHLSGSKPLQYNNCLDELRHAFNNTPIIYTQNIAFFFPPTHFV